MSNYISQNPYENIDEKGFWKTGVANTSPLALKNIYTKKWKLNANDQIATAGSCFAQHISYHLSKNNFNILDVELAPDVLPKEKHHKFGYSMYSARYGNIYTVRQLLQLAQEIAGEYEPQEIIWKKDNQYYDALRPNIEPQGLTSIKEVELHRQYHLKQVKQLFLEMDVFIYTLGLTEAWVHKKSGTVYPIAPGIIAGQFDDEQYVFKNFEFEEIITDFKQFIQTIGHFRADNKPPKIILTVSPVPLTATASGQHILQANMYSKAILRAVAGYLTKHFSYIDYFPSFEIITNPAARGIYYANNLRSITNEGVEIVMKAFFNQHQKQTLKTKSNNKEVEVDLIENDIECEEAILEAFGK